VNIAKQRNLYQNHFMVLISCLSGKVQLPPLNQPPEPLLSYMTRSNTESKKFMQNIYHMIGCLHKV